MSYEIGVIGGASLQPTMCEGKVAYDGAEKRCQNA